MIHKFKAVIVKPGLWGLTKKDIRDSGREAMRAPLLMWHRQMKHLHFQKFAVGKYGYKPNSAAYERRKLHDHPESEGRPMVYSGDSESRAMASEGIKVKAKSWEKFSGEAIINAPTLNYQRLADQVTRVTPSELGTLQNEFATGFIANFLAMAQQKQGMIRLAG